MRNEHFGISLVEAMAAGAFVFTAEFQFVLFGCSALISAAQSQVKTRFPSSFYDCRGHCDRA